jgi:hypothetical protein
VVEEDGGDALLLLVLLLVMLLKVGVKKLKEGLGEKVESNPFNLVGKLDTDEFVGPSRACRWMFKVGDIEIKRKQRSEKESD